MIKIIKGIYGHVDGGRIVPRTSKDPPFSLTPEKEAQLVRKGVAQYTDENPSGRQMNSEAPKKKSKKDGKVGG